MSDVKNDFVLFIEVFCHRRENPPEFRFAISIWDINTRDAGNPFLQFVPVPALFCFGSEERNDSCRGMPTEQSFRKKLRLKCRSLVCILHLFIVVQAHKCQQLQLIAHLFTSSFIRPWPLDVFAPMPSSASASLRMPKAAFSHSSQFSGADKAIKYSPVAERNGTGVGSSQSAGGLFPLP